MLISILVEDPPSTHPPPAPPHPETQASFITIGKKPEAGAHKPGDDTLGMQDTDLELCVIVHDGTHCCTGGVTSPGARKALLNRFPAVRFDSRSAGSAACGACHLRRLRSTRQCRH